MIIVDTGPLVALGDRDDANHQRCKDWLLSVREPLVIPTLVITEVCYLLSRGDRPDVEVAFLRSMLGGPFTFADLDRRDFWRAAQLAQQYQNLPLGVVDAYVIAVAERLESSKVATLDRRHFTIVRPCHIPAFELLPG